MVSTLRCLRKIGLHEMGLHEIVLMSPQPVLSEALWLIRLAAVMLQSRPFQKSSVSNHMRSSTGDGA
jgi:hypothetical protein